jgi:hypothetical protein
VLLLSVVAGLVAGIVVDVSGGSAYESVALGLLLAIFSEQVLESHRRRLYEEKFGFLLRVERDPELSGALAYAEELTEGLRQAVDDAAVFRPVRDLAQWYLLSDGNWRGARMRQYPVAAGFEERLTALSIDHVRGQIRAWDPDLEWWAEDEAAVYLRGHEALVRRALRLTAGAPLAETADLPDDEYPLRRIFVLQDDQDDELVKQVLAQQRAAGVRVRILRAAKPQDLLDAVIYDDVAVRYAQTTPTGGEAVNAVLSTVQLDVQTWGRRFEQDWRRAKPGDPLTPA